MGVVNIIDSHLLSRRMPNLRTFLLPVGAAHLASALIPFFLFPLPEETTPRIILLALLTGILRVSAVLIMLRSLTREAVSRVIPVIHIYPIFVAIMAVPILGESLRYQHWLTIIIVVAGAVMVSIKHNPTGATTWFGKPLLLLLVSSLLFALSDISSKYVLAYISFWNLFSLTAFCMSGVFLLISLRPGILADLRQMTGRASVLTLILIDEALALLGIILSLRALEQGPVSLVSAITGSRPMFVVIFALILGRISPQFLIGSASRQIVILRLIGTAMIVAGIALIYLT